MKMTGRSFFSVSRLLALGLLSLITFGSVACFHFHSKSPEEKAAMMTDRISQRLDLDEQQKMKAQALTASFLVVAKDFSSQKGQILQDLRTEVLAPTIDKDKVQGMILAQLAKAQGQVPDLIEKLADFHQSLNDNQKLQIAALLERANKH